MNFRYDINGLRAVAVIAVVLFHFQPNLLTGGFAGVDVFFVISGFLMTGIIFRGFESDSFSLFKFYVARANRIIPALAVLCLTMFVFGWLCFTPIEYKLLSKHIISSLGFISNIMYWKESGYFDVGSHEKWLIHTWSLSVEWQFYIIYPLILMVFKKIFTLKTVKKLLLAATILGFMFSVVSAIKWPNPSYFLLPARAWEMMLGGVAFVYPVVMANTLKKMTEFVGLLLIVLSCIFVTNAVPWPGYYALASVAGAYLIVIANRQDSIITNNLVFQSIGRWSYSIYLWHWPIVVFGFFSYKQWWAIGIPLSVLLGFLSYHFVESYKFKSFVSWKKIFQVKPLWATGLVGALSVFVFISNGADRDFRQAARSEKVEFLARYNKDNYINNYFKQEYRSVCNYFDADSRTAKHHDIDTSCYEGEPDSGGIFLWGDSHAQALSHGLRHIFPDVKFNQIASSWCRPLVENDTQTNGDFKISCDRSNKKAFETIQHLNPKVIILAQYDRHDENDFLKIVEKLRSNGVTSKIILIGPQPQWYPSLPKAIAKRHMDREDKVFTDPYFYSKLWKINKTLVDKYFDTEIEYISVINSLCKDKKCLAKVDDNNTPLVWDYGHLTFEGSEYVVKHIIAPKIQDYLYPESEDIAKVNKEQDKTVFLDER